MVKSRSRAPLLLLLGCSMSWLRLRLGAHKSKNKSPWPDWNSNSTRWWALIPHLLLDFKGTQAGWLHSAPWGSALATPTSWRDQDTAGTQLKVIQLKLMKEADPSPCLTAHLLKLFPLAPHFYNTPGVRQSWSGRLVRQTSEAGQWYLKSPVQTPHWPVLINAFLNIDGFISLSVWLCLLCIETCTWLFHLFIYLFIYRISLLLSSQIKRVLVVATSFFAFSTQKQV